MQENFEFCSVDSVYLAQKYSTPLYVMSQDIIEEKIDYIKVNFLDKYPRTYAYYASKAFTSSSASPKSSASGFQLHLISGSTTEKPYLVNSSRSTFVDSPDQP